MALREAAVAKAEADQERVRAQTASEAKQAEFVKEMNLKKAAFDAEVARATAEKERGIFKSGAVRVRMAQRRSRLRVLHPEFTSNPSIAAGMIWGPQV